MIVLITGASSGIGKATAYTFAQNGNQLILTGRREDRLHCIKEDIEKKYNVIVNTLVFDVRDRKAVKKNLTNLPNGIPAPDVLINNAGLAKGFSPIHEGDIEHWETMIDTNLKGLLYVTKIISQKMVAQKFGQIINVCSIAGKEVYPNGNVYNATKFAVDALTKAMRMDLHRYNIRVGQVCPGHVEETEFALNRFDGDREKAKIYENFQPLRSIDIAEMIHFMATRPLHVNIKDVVIWGSQQASATMIHQSGRK